MHRHINVRGIIINDRGELFCQRLTARTGDGRDFGAHQAVGWSWARA